MRLGLVLPIMFLSAVSFAQGYPVAGSDSANYQKVFELMKQGQCGSMDSALAELQSVEGVSGNIYKAICWFDNGSVADGVATFDTMLKAEEYDEIIYVAGYFEKEGKSSPLVKKYKGKALYKIGDSAGAANELKASLAMSEDSDARYFLTDIYLDAGDTESAKAVLTKSKVKDGGYYIRMAKINLKDGEIVSAYENLRQVKKGEAEYGQAENYLAQMCAAQGRFICADKSAKELSTVSGYEETAKKTAQSIDDKKKPFGVLILLKEEYDNNVTSVDEDAIDSATEESSFRSSVVADLKYNIYTPYADKMTVGLFNYKSWNHSLSAYNLQMHKAYFMVKQGYDKFDIVLPKLSAAVTYFGGEKYSEAFTAEASADYKMDTLTFSLPVKIESRNYYSDSSDDDYDKDGTLYAIGIGAEKIFMKKYTAGLAFDVENDEAKGSEKDSLAYITTLTASAKVTDKISVNLSGVYTYTDYSDSTDDREDDKYKTDLSLLYKVNKTCFITGGISWEKKDSTTDAYDYQKTVLSTGIGYNY